LIAASASRLPRYLAVAYTLLAVYGSLHPFAGWTDSGAPPLAFLTAGWPRYLTVLDVAVNVLTYVPLGFLWLAALRPALGRWLAPVAAVLIGALLALAMESVQNFLPSRVPSSLDLACNIAGTLIGSVIGAFGSIALVDGGRLHAMRHRLIQDGVWADWGLLLVLLWLLTQFNPEILLFGNGDLHRLIGLPAPLPYSAETFQHIEAAVVAANTAAVGLLVSLLLRRRAQALLVLAAALVAKTVVFLLIMNGKAGLGWATDGSLIGLATGFCACLVALPLAAVWRRALAALLLFLATTLVNLAPENPYLVNTFQTWNPGQFLNFHGLTRLTSDLWPFLALPWLMMRKGET
jgi:VanZ family protein